MITTLWILAIIAAILVLIYQRASMYVWDIAGVIGLALVSWFGPFSMMTNIILWIFFAVPMTILNIIPLRRQLFTRSLYSIYKKMMPTMSATEQEAIAAGTVKWAGELFQGAPNWHAMLAHKKRILTEEEQTFLDGPVEELCAMIDDWDITHNRYDLPPKVWEFLKEKGFFGMIIPKEYGGLGFSATAHSAAITKASSTGVTIASTIAVPNSLGPAELILKYGTEEQRSYYLPKLAKGEEIPCFALTNPEAGSDASAIPDNGVVCEGEYKGKKVIGIRLNFDKRYITLAPIATVIGLAFKMYDPDRLLSDKEYIGITCALLPRDLPGIEIGRRHLPLNIAFQNGPIRGKDVFIPLDLIIGGKAQAGKGWHMLVECLSVGRGISLPSIAVGNAKACALLTGAYAHVRCQFGLPIGQFEGVEEALARIAGNTYFMDAMREMTVAIIDRDEKPAILTAITKYHTTTRARDVINDAMDIHGGKGICLGPHNYLGRGYQGQPISITVEGANILTRSMIIFGQGAIRCHPYALTEINAANSDNPKRGLHEFDKAIVGHAGFILSNSVRSLLLGLSNAYIVISPGGSARRYYQQLTRFSSAFALLADMTMLVVGADLKRKERLSGRLGDVLSMLYAGSAILKRFHDDGEPIDELPLLHWTCQEILFIIQQRMDTLLANFPNRWLAWLLRVLIFPLGRCLRYPDDKIGHRLARLLLSPSETRTRLTKGIYKGIDGASPVGRHEAILKEIIAILPLEKQVCKAFKEGKIKGYTFLDRVTAAEQAKVISKKEAERVRAAHAARMDVIAVDDFGANELQGKDQDRLITTR